MDLTEPSSSNDMKGCFCNPHPSGSGVTVNANIAAINQRRQQQQQELEDSAMNKLLNEKLKQMSLEEHPSGVGDINGVSEAKETPEMIENGIKEMNQALNRMVLEDREGNSGYSNDNRPSSLTYYYRLALKKSSDYVESLKLPCLRAERYDSSKAAMVMLRFFQRKAELFGEESLVRALEFERDLGEDGKEAMSRGLFQVLPHRDRSGRAIMFVYGKISSSEYSTDTVMRCLMYICMSPMLQDVETQKRGVVAIGYQVFQQDTVPGRPAAIIQNWRSTPVRISDYHFFNTNASTMIMPVYILFKYLEQRSISRFKIHTGTPLECVYNLMTCGIPKDVIPVNVTDGSVDLTSQCIMLETLKHIEKTNREKTQRQFLQHATTPQSQPQPQTPPLKSTSSVATCMASSANTNIGIDMNESEMGDMPLKTATERREDNNEIVQQQPVPGVRSGSNTKAHQTENIVVPETELILVPGPMDIIMGKGRRPQSRPGSLRLHNLMLQYREQYDKSTKSGKTDLANVILNEVKNAGCRFLTVESSSSSSSSSSRATTSTTEKNDKSNSSNNKSTIYVECDDATARLRIAHGFRNMRSRTHKRPQQKSSSEDDADSDSK